jgi:S1-C subfamily serine protease
VGITRIAEVGEDTMPGMREGEGILILELLRGSPADRAGVEPGDVVLAVDGRAIESAGQLRNELARAPVGSKLRLTVARGRRRLDLTVAVEEAGA